MESTETIDERALRQLRMQFIRRLNVDDHVLDYLHQEGALTFIACEEIRCKKTRFQRASELLDWVTQKSVVPTFMEGLKCGGSHMLLAKLLTDEIQNLNNDELKLNKSKEHDSGSCKSENYMAENEPDTRNSDIVQATDVTMEASESRSHTINSDKRPVLATDVTMEASESIDKEMEEFENDDKKEVIHEPPRKIDIMDRKKRLLTKIHYHLKLLSHDGKKVKFDDFISRHKANYLHDPDIMFTLLDAEVESRRLVYDTGLHKGSIFDDMENCITYSAHPVANTMTFLARKGSARTMKESLEVGLDMLEEARSLSEHIQPCKDTGMVLYIIINILLQMYEKNPTLEIKDTIIRKIDEAIKVHFAEGPSFLREDYTRMLYLKMVFCYLGIGLFGNTIEECVVSEADVKSAETCLQIIDSIQAKFDNRRQMFYYMAKSVLYRKHGKQTDALENAKLAKWRAEICNFSKELGPILELTGGLEQELANTEHEEIKAREVEIEKELMTLESEKGLVQQYLKRSSNQWGEATTDNSTAPSKKRRK